MIVQSPLTFVPREDVGEAKRQFQQAIRPSEGRARVSKETVEGMDYSCAQKGPRPMGYSAGSW
jgi:hypothetical protein